MGLVSSRYNYGLSNSNNTNSMGLFSSLLKLFVGGGDANN